MVKPKLLLLSDLFGDNPEWIKYYIKILAPQFDVKYYDVLKIAEIGSLKNEAEIHNRFLDGGIEKAVNNLLNYEKEKVVILGFSIGGTIAWKASLSGLRTTYLFAVSSTRLRYETKSPDCAVKLYFGENDLNKPSSKWFLDLDLENIILNNQGHQLYMNQNTASLICDDILKYVTVN
ncbi:hypothetical protein L1276_002035 [Flavobacterium sp. HSC-32F16]|uniref:alpha/beta hydrolase n=1 Tax=Flavobacterium sp. HSC-32F16 TaxID=2910964 RepID=UPI0020A592C3|nr:alpha/beta hydrolase [Flavobacterium sp. HSC-32F16]MCP2026891.1 hypothetical protein [Flavobacterium sp. HSC-32F16]